MDITVLSRGKIIEDVYYMAAGIGAFPGPEGIATLAAQVHLLDSGWLKPNETMALSNTGTPLKHLLLWA